jgi:YVTN family beta-propeller protein
MRMGFVKSFRPFCLLAGLLLGLVTPTFAIWHCGDIGLPATPRAIIQDPISCDFFIATGGPYLIRIDEATYEVTQVDLGTAATALGINTSTRLLYAVHEAADMVTTLNIDTGTTGLISVGDGPAGIAIDALRDIAYVLALGDSTIWVIQGTTVTDTIECAGRPSAIAVDPLSGKGFVTLSDADLLLTFDTSSGDTAHYATGSQPTAIEIDPEKGEVYIADSQANSITAFRVEADSVFTIPLVNFPRSLALNPETKHLFVGMAASGVIIVDTDTYSTVNVGLPSVPGHVAIDPLSDRGFASLPGDGLIAEMSPAGDTLLVSAAGTPDEFIVNPITNKCYVCNPGSQSISVLEAANFSGFDIPAGAGPGQIAINFESHEVYTPNWFTANVTIIDGYTDATSTLKVADGPNGFKIDPVTDDLYVVCAWAGRVTLKRSGSPDTILIPIGEYAHGMTLNLNTQTAYVSNRYSDDLSVIDMQTLDTTRVRMGNYPCFVDVNMETNTMYVTNRTSWTLTVIDGALLTTDFARIGPGPTAVRVNPHTNKAIAVDTNQRTISVVDGETLDRVVIPVGTTPRGLSINKNTNTFYVSSGIDGEVTVVDGDTYRRTPVPCAHGLFATKVDPWLDKAYVVSWDLASVHMIDGNFLTTLRIPVGAEPHGTAYDPVLEKLYVSNHATNSVEIMKLRDKISPRIEVEIDTLASDVAYSRTPTITGTATSLRTPRNYGIMKVLYKIDNLRGPWSEATITGSGPSVTWELTTPELLLGSHLIFVAAIDSSASTLSSTSASSLGRTSDPACYEFTCLTSPPPAPELVRSDDGPTGSPEVAWTNTCGDRGWYDIEMASDPSFSVGVTRISNVHESSYSLNAAQIGDGTRYLRVAAVDYPHGKRSEFSDVYTLNLADLVDDETDPGLMPLTLRAFPNPSPAVVALRLLGRTGTQAHCSIFDVAGRLVTVLPMVSVDDGLAGTWDAKDARGNLMPPGVYYAQIRTAGTTLRHKIILLR